jgi:hypothetical protein
MSSISLNESLNMRQNLTAISLCLLALLIIFSPEIIDIDIAHYLTSLFAQQSITQLMQGAGMAILTLLISFAIGILIHHLGDGERKDNFLHLHVALDHVWFFKPTLVVLIINFVSPFFMGSQILFWNVFIFCIWVTSFIWLCVIVLRIYEWVKGDKDDFIKGYLSSTYKTAQDKIITWGEFWGTDLNIKKRFTEAEFFIPFSQQINELIKSEKEEDWSVAFKMLEGFKNSIGKRNKIFITIFPEFFPKILEWHFMVWSKQYGRFKKGVVQEVKKIDVHLFEIDHLIDEIIKYVTKQSLIETDHAHSYFNFLDIHIKKYGDESIIGDDYIYDYINQIPIYLDCLNMIPKSSQSHDIWNRYFPSEWKITIENFKKNRITRVWYGHFLEWSQHKIWKPCDELDTELDEVSRELFPNVDPNVWAKIYTFVLRPWSSSRIKEIIDKKIKFGFLGRIYSGFGEDFEKEFVLLNKEYLENTIELAIFLFGKVFTEEHIDSWLEELEKLEYSKDSDEYLKQQSWIGIMRALKNKYKENK